MKGRVGKNWGEVTGRETGIRIYYEKNSIFNKKKEDINELTNLLINTRITPKKETMKYL